MPDPQEKVIRFGPFEADLVSGELRKKGVRLKLQELPRRILFLLLQEPGEVVARSDLQQALWASDTFVDFERGLNTAMSKLRDVLGDSAASPKYIETVPKRGYRFIGEIQYAEPEPGPAKVVPLIRQASAGGANAAAVAVPQPEGEPRRVASPFVLPPPPRQEKVGAGGSPARLSRWLRLPRSAG
jgi:DNA-binding winged helix-turn-helix (wHTH) protein